MLVMRSVFDAFTGPNFNPVFSDTAVAPWAEHAAHVDLETHQSRTRQAIRDVVHGAAQNGAPTQRIALIQGDAGLGKTHVIISELGKLSRDEAVYPAILQLAVQLAPEDISLWMLRTAIDELSKTHFKDSQNRSPLKRLADHLWTHAPPDRKAAYENALQDDDESQILALARTAAPTIRAGLSKRGVRREHEPIIVGLLLVADDASAAFPAWLRGGSREVRMGEHILPPLMTEADRQRTLISLATIAAATGAPLILVFDQIEAVSRITDHGQLGKLFASAIQLVENGIVGTGIIFSALEATFERVKAGHLDGGFISRIERGVSPVLLVRPDHEQLRGMLDKRAAYLMELSGYPEELKAGEMMAPPWLLSRLGDTLLRPALQAVRDYHEACKEAGRLLEEHEYAPPKAELISPDAMTSEIEPPVPNVEFEKLWQDAIDADVGAVTNIPIAEKADLFEWLAKNAAMELPQIHAVGLDRFTVEGPTPTTTFDLQFKDSENATLERWKIGLVHAPNSQGQLRDQIATFLDNSYNAMPAMLRLGPQLPRIRADGEPVTSVAHVRGKNGQPQAGEPLANLLEVGGRIAPTDQRDWIRLRLARQFVEARKDAKGFGEWRAQRRFLLTMAGLGTMTKLLNPKIGAVSPKPPEPPQRSSGHPTLASNGAYIEQAQPPSEVHTASSAATDDLPDSADIHLGWGLANGQKVRWRLDRLASPPLPNFGLMVSGDAGQGKTQIIKAVVSDVASLDCPVLIFDFKNDYGDAGDGFASKCGFEIIELNDGLPFNPLQLPPHGASGSQAIKHIFEVAGLLGTTLRLGDRQKALLRQALEAAYSALSVPLREWIDPNAVRAPSLNDVIERARSIDEASAAGLIDRLGLLHGMRLLPSTAGARMRLADLLQMRAVLSFNALPNDDQLKKAIAELILIQLQGYMLRGDQPRALRKLLVFDEAWRAADSKRLIQITREGRAFGVGVVAGSQFADDLSTDLTGILASKLHLYNSDAGKRRKLVKSLLGTATGAQAQDLTRRLSALKQFEAVFTNQQYAPYVCLRLTPYFEREETTKALWTTPIQDSLISDENNRHPTT